MVLNAIMTYEQCCCLSLQDVHNHMIKCSSLSLFIGFYAKYILWYQVSAHAHDLLSVGLRGLDELGHPTVGTFSIYQRDKVKHACTAT